MTRRAPPTFAGYRLTWLAEENGPEVQALLARCADYLALVADLQPSPELAHDVFTLLPPGKRREEKVLLGLASARGGGGVRGVVWPV